MSLDSNLAKELKETGFPKHKCADFVEGEIICGLCDQGINPTLSELIEACGDNLYALYRHYGSWQAHSNSDQWDTEIADGATPEEAVARLWLELNKK